MPASDKLDDTLNKLCIAVEKLSASNKSPEVDPRRHFYKIFNQEADEYDRDFHKKYHDDLNTTLIFAGLFSAVASAFIVDIQQELRPDYNKMSFTVMTMLLNTTSGVPNQLDIPVASRPKASAVQVQSILFSSLASALLAAFLAMLGKQWLNLHVEGSLIDRSRHRELKMRGMITWRFKFIMECLPLVMQVSLLLLGCALARYTWDLSRTVSAAIAAFTVFGFLFYLVIVFAATFWKTCPFQTPVSLGFRYILSVARQYQHPWSRTARDRLSEAVNFEKLNESFLTATLHRSIDEEHSPDANIIPNTLTTAATMAKVEGDESTHASDTNCISTMFRFASGSDAIVAVAGFIPEVNWALKVRRVPILEVCHSLSRSFELLKDGRVLVRPGMREQAYRCAKALLHMRVQRICVGAMEDVRAVTLKLNPLFGYRSREDHELESTLRALDAVFNGDSEIPWKEFVFSDAHYCWLGHVLRCRAWAVLRTQITLPEDTLGFVRHSFSIEPPPPRQVIADCLLMIRMIIWKLPEFDDKMLIRDKSAEIEVTIQDIYRGLKLGLTSHSPVKRQRTVEVLELMANLKHQVACTESFKLFRTIVAAVDSDNWFWRPAELLLVGAFKWNGFRPFVEDPEGLLEFLRRCLLDQERGLARDQPIEQIMFALGGAPEGEISAGLAGVDFSEPLFFNGLCHALRKDAPYRLRRGTVAFLRHLDTQLFDTNTTIFTEEQAGKLVSAWSASAGESLEVSGHSLLARASMTTLLGLLDSTFWREFIPDERWDILKYLNGIDDELIPPAAYRCFRNPTIIPYLLKLRERGVGAFTLWMAIIWAKYPDLSEEVATQLGTTTRGVAYSHSKSTVAFYASVMDGEMERVRRKINSHHSWSFEEGIVKLRSRRDALQLARQGLAQIQMIVK